MRREFLVLWVPANDLLADASVQCVCLMSAPGLKLARPRFIAGVFLLASNRRAEMKHTPVAVQAQPWNGTRLRAKL